MEIKDITIGRVNDEVKAEVKDPQPTPSSDPAKKEATVKKTKK